MSKIDKLIVTFNLKDGVRKDPLRNIYTGECPYNTETMSVMYIPYEFRPIKSDELTREAWVSKSDNTIITLENNVLEVRQSIWDDAFEEDLNNVITRFSSVLQKSVVSMFDAAPLTIASAR